MTDGYFPYPPEKFPPALWRCPECGLTRLEEYLRTACGPRLCPGPHRRKGEAKPEMDRIPIMPFTEECDPGCEWPVGHLPEHPCGKRLSEQPKVGDPESVSYGVRCKTSTDIEDADVDRGDAAQAAGASATGTTPHGSAETAATSSGPTTSAVGICRPGRAGADDPGFYAAAPLESHHLVPRELVLKVISA